MATYLLVVGLLFNVIIGLTVLLSDSRRTINRLLFFLAFSSALWQISNYFADKDTAQALLWNKLSFVGPLLIVFFFLLFVRALKGTVVFGRITKSAALVTIFFISISVFSSLIVGDVTPRFSDDIFAGYNIQRGILYPVVVLWLVGLLGYTVFELSKEYRYSKGKIKTQTAYIMVGLTVAASIGLVTNVFIPAVTGDSSTAQFAPFSSIVFLGFTAFAIVRHGLFNIRLVVARSLAYVFSIGAILVMFGVAFMLLTTYIFRNEIIIDTTQVALLILAMIGAALSLNPAKRYFDKITNKIFYRDAYDAQSFIDELNKLLVSTVDIEHLLNGSVEIIERNIKAQYCSFVIRETSYFEQRVLGGRSGSFSKDEMKILKDTASKLRSKVIAADDVEDTYPELAEVLKDHDVAVLVRLVTTLDYDVEGIGYIMLGYKKSGNPYTSQDLRVLEIVGNELVISTQNALRFEEIENFNITLQEKIDNATRQLRKTNEKLKTLDETKDEFISMASHQLRTPLTSVKGYLSMVLEGDAGELNEMQVRLLDQAFVSSQRMVYLIADLLNISRLRTGKFLVEPSPVNLANLIEGEIAQLVDTAASRKLELVYEKPDDFPLLMLDETKIRQVVMNFVDNAIYYTPSGGKIIVKLEDKGSSIEYRVVDNGIGVPKAEQHHLFTKFYRAGNAKKARPDGTGLGLFMAKKVIAAQGGSIIFESQEDKGSTFGFTFSKEKLAVPDNYTLEKKEKKSLKSLV
jgi:signal transduction histidine kinase